MAREIAIAVEAGDEKVIIEAHKQVSCFNEEMRARISG